MRLKRQTYRPDALPPGGWKACAPYLGFLTGLVMLQYNVADKVGGWKMTWSVELKKREGRNGAFAIGPGLEIAETPCGDVDHCRRIKLPRVPFRGKFPVCIGFCTYITQVDWEGRKSKAALLISLLRNGSRRSSRSTSVVLFEVLKALRQQHCDELPIHHNSICHRLQGSQYWEWLPPDCYRYE